MLTWGQLGRSPDILAPYISNLVARKEAFSAIEHPKCDFGENILNYYKYCKENDLFLTHALGDPRSTAASSRKTSSAPSPEDEEIALHVVEETDAGIIRQRWQAALDRRRAQQRDLRLALADVLPAQRPALRPRVFDRDQLEGLEDPRPRACRTLVRLLGPPAADARRAGLHALLRPRARPLDRVFFLYESPQRVGGAPTGAELNFAGWANLERAHYRMRLMTAVATMVAEAIGVIGVREVAAKLGEMVTYCEMWRHAMNGIEHGGRSSGGRGGGQGMGVWMAGTSARMVELLREICGSGIIMQPSENDLANPEIRPYIEKFMRGKDVDVEYKSRLFRFAHDLAASSFGMRQDIDEYWHGGDPNRNRINLLRGYDQSDIINRIKDEISKPLPHGEVP